MAKSTKEPQYAFSGRTIGRMLKKSKRSNSEPLKMRAKTQLGPAGRNRYPFEKYYDWEKDPDNLKGHQFFAQQVKRTYFK